MKFPSYQRKVIDASIIILIMFLLLSSSCGVTTTNNTTDLQISEQNVINLKPIQEWRLKYVLDIEWNMDSDMFAVAGGESDENDASSIHVFSINNSEVFWSSRSIGGGTLAYSPDNRVIAIPYFEGIELFDANTGAKVRQIDHDFMKAGQICIGGNRIRFTKDGSKIITLDTSAESIHTGIYVWDAKTDQCLGTLAEEIGTSFDFELSRDGQFLALGFPDAPPEIPGVFEPQVHVWNIEARQLTCRFKGARPAVFSPDGNIIVAGNVDKIGDVDLWDAKSCQLVDTLHRQEPNGPFSMDFSPGGKLLAVGGSETFQIWDIANRKLLFESGKLPNHVNILSFSPDGQLLLSETDNFAVNGIITLWEVSQ